MEILLHEKDIDKVVADFCLRELINETDEISLSNYAIVTVESESLAKACKDLIEEIDQLDTDQLLKNCYTANKFSLGQIGLDGEHLPDKETNIQQFHSYLDDLKDDLEVKIDQATKYRQMPFRIFEREAIYVDLRLKLMANLIRAIGLCKKEGKQIIKHYKRIDIYIERNVIGVEGQVINKKQKKNTAVMILNKKKQLQSKEQKDKTESKKKLNFTGVSSRSDNFLNTSNLVMKNLATNMKGNSLFQSVDPNLRDSPTLKSPKHLGQKLKHDPSQPQYLKSKKLF